MEIREMPLEQLHTADYNPRVALEPGDPEFERLKNSIETFGEVAPIVWNQRTAASSAAIKGWPSISTSAARPRPSPSLTSTRRKKSS